MIKNIGKNSFIINILSVLIVIISANINIDQYTSNTFYLRSEHNYNNQVNMLCPNELDDNIAGKNGLYFNTSDSNIKKSIVKKYFNHCGAWCLFDYRDPRKGWYWNMTLKTWIYYNNLYTFCPKEEFHNALDKFLIEKHIF